MKLGIAAVAAVTLFAQAPVASAQMPPPGPGLDQLASYLSATLDAMMHEGCAVRSYSRAERPIDNVHRNYRRSYWKQFADGQERLVGFFDAGIVDEGHLVFPVAYWLDAQQRSVSTIAMGQQLNWMSFYSPPRGAQVALINAYQTVDPSTFQQVEDYNGNCGGDGFGSLVRDGLWDNWLECLRNYWVRPTAQVLCAG